ncbi:CheR family methyltransferase [Nodosilinea sp. E11]|uniref:CheR family methyltransferase n=1 Tax=Nodosilinea sp. E11 TaxID=3037479 RepID=UPI002934188B|nr:CheR family methyltransferase [Nodosilinea sp. E11]WOD36986.1 CheR family methyltransferase [Nodosilinea sp. E11]
MMSPPRNSPKFVVGLGAFAGGLPALQQFFAAMPSDSGVAFVVVLQQHPDFESLMQELLRPHTNMVVQQVITDVTLQPNQVYLIPPGQNLVLQSGRLHLVDQSPRPRSQVNLSIDLFFESLASDCGDRAIGVVLSGGGQDGSQGLSAIRAAGGVTLAHAPATAIVPAMPQHAIDRGVVRRTLPPDELARLIYEFTQPGGQSYFQTGNPTDAVIEPATLRQILDLLDASENLDFSHYKTSTLSRRTYLRCSLSGCNTIDEYLNCLRHSAEERQRLKQDYLIGVTHFFRDSEAWQVLEHRILPDLLTALIQAQTDTLRAWVSACATGEEAYSLAILLDYLMEQMEQRMPIKIFATDVNTHALQQASEGAYPEQVANDLPASLLNKYFTWRNGRFHVKRRIRENIIFAPHNLLENPGFTQMHLISCRNMLIYMRPDSQQQVLRTIHFSLAAKGVLFLGECENLGDLEAEFTPLNQKWKIFQKRRDVRLPLLNLPSVGRFSQSSTASSSNFRSTEKSPSPLNPLLQQALVNVYASRQATCVLLDNHQNLLHVVVDAARLLQVPQGKVTQQITAMLPDDLRVPVSTALSRAYRDGEPVTYIGIPAKTIVGDRSLQITATYTSSGSSIDGFATLVLEDNRPDPPSPAIGKSLQLGEDTTLRIIELEHELQRSRESLQSTIEELETINEELQSTNEELLASNEELQSTNEEFQSQAEELYTINAEYQAKIAELTELTADFNNLLQSIDIGVIFLDLDLSIRKFTEAATVAVNLVETDINRPLMHLTHSLEGINLLEPLQEVFETECPLEREVRLTTTGENLLMRVHPYCQRRGQVDGLVITFVNINELKETERQLSETLELLETTYTTTPVGLCLLDADLCYIRINPVLAAIDGLPVADHLGKTPGEILPDLADTLEPILRQVIETGEAITNLEITGTTPAAPDEIRHWIASYYPVGDRVGAVVTEVTDLKRTQEALVKNESLFRLTLDQSNIMVFTQDCDLAYQWVYNPLTGFTEADFLHKTDPEIFSGINIQPLTNAKQQVLASQTRQTLQFRLDQAGGDRYFNLKLEPLIDLDGRLVGIAGAAYEVTEEKQIALALAYANDQVRAASQAKSSFLAVMSHELRTPLNAILGMTENLLEGILGEVSDRQIHALATIEQSSTHLLNLINDILDLSKVEAGQLEPIWAVVSVPELCHRSLELVTQQAQKKQITLDLDRPADLPNLWGDARRLQQVLVNLLDNAVKFTPKGGQVTLAIRAEDDRVSFSVTDTGIGIAAADIPTLFQPFTQVESDLSRQYDGTGLGLAVVKQLVELHGGEVFCTSTVGVGSSFTIVLPIQSPTLAPQLNPEPSPAPAIGASTPISASSVNSSALILLAEDNEANIEATTSYLEAKGFRLIVAHNGTEAVAMARSEKPALILMDVQMPGVNGLEAIRQIRQDLEGNVQNIPIIALTALSMAGDRERCLRAGATEYMSKPVKLKTLTAKVQELLAGP